MSSYFVIVMKDGHEHQEIAVLTMLQNGQVMAQPSESNVMPFIPVGEIERIEVRTT